MGLCRKQRREYKRSREESGNKNLKKKLESISIWKNHFWETKEVTFNVGEVKMGTKSNKGPKVQV